MSRRLTGGMRTMFCSRENRRWRRSRRRGRAHIWMTLRPDELSAAKRVRFWDAQTLRASGADGRFFGRGTFTKDSRSLRGR